MASQEPIYPTQEDMASTAITHLSDYSGRSEILVAQLSGQIAMLGEVLVQIRDELRARRPQEPRDA